MANIISAIPLTDQTNPAKFPPYEFREYPKMMLRKVTKEDIAAWDEANKRTDDRSGKAYWPAGRPKLDAQTAILNEDGTPCIVHDLEEEEAFRAEHPEVVEPSGQALAGSERDELELLRAENAKLRKQREDSTEGKDAKLQATADAGNAKPAEPAKSVGSLVKNRDKPKPGTNKLPSKLK